MGPDPEKVENHCSGITHQPHFALAQDISKHNGQIAMKLGAAWLLYSHGAFRLEAKIVFGAARTHTRTMQRQTGLCNVELGAANEANRATQIKRNSPQRVIAPVEISH